MTSTRLPVSFSLEPDSPLDTLELVLATARRVGLRLTRLQLQGDQVTLVLEHDEADALTLFCARLDNLIGVYNIVINVCMLPIRQKYRTLRRSPMYNPKETHANEEHPARNCHDADACQPGS